MAEFALLSLSGEKPRDYEEWVVRNLSELRGHKIRSLCIAAIPEDEDIAVMTGYYNASHLDKERMADAVRDDAIWQMVKTNMEAEEEE